MSSYRSIQTGSFQSNRGTLSKVAPCQLSLLDLETSRCAHAVLFSTACAMWLPRSGKNLCYGKKVREIHEL